MQDVLTEDRGIEMEDRMAEVLMRGADVNAAMKENMTGRVERLKEKGIQPVLNIIRVGKRANDLAYERGAGRHMESVGDGFQT